EQEAAERIAALGKPRLVITGGEPLLQGPALARMLEALAQIAPGMSTEVETNGTVAPHPALDPRIAQFTVSPKLAHSGNPADLALPPDRLRHWASEPRAVFKFVIAQPADVEEVLALSERYAIPPARIWLMAEGTDPATLASREGWLAATCL